MVLIFISILSLCITHAMGAPQLKLDNAGYEIISINDRNSEDTLPLVSKMIFNGASRDNEIVAPILEKASYPIDINDESSSSLHQHKRHYDFRQSFPLPKSTSESRLNAIDGTKKVSSNKKSNIYLTLGIPKISTKSANFGNEYPIVIPISERTNEKSPIDDFNDDSDSSDESVDQEKSVDKSFVRSKIIDKDAKSVGTSKEWIANTTDGIGNDVTSSAMIESEFESTDSKDDEKMPTIMTDVNRSMNFVDGKSDSRNSKNRIESSNVKSSSAMVTHFPSVQILQQKTPSIRHKHPAMISPIFPSGFDIPVGNLRKKTSFAIKEPRGKYFSIDRKNAKSKKKFQKGFEDAKNRFSINSGEFGKSYGDTTNHGISSVFVVNDVSNDVSNLKSESLMSFPIAMAPMNFQHLPLSNHEPPEVTRHGLTRFEINSIPLVASHFDHSFPTSDSFILYPQERSEKFTFGKSMDVEKRRQLDNDSNQQFTNYRTNHVITSTDVSADLSKIFTGSTRFLSTEPILRNSQPAREILPPNVESPKNLAIDIVHEIATDDSPETIIDDKKKETTKGRRELQDVANVRRTAMSNNGCKHGKPNTPPFYNFLEKFTNIMMGNALQYESNNSVANGVSKKMEMVKKK